MATDLSTGKQFNPFYQNVDKEVVDELNKRGAFYGSRVRSERVVPGQKGFPEAERLLWSYGKVAYGIISAGSAADGSLFTMGSDNNRVMSDRNGNLTLYDSTRNQPKFPLLQSIELSNEGTIGSLLKGSFSFTIYPDIAANGFIMDKIEKAFFTPGKEVTIKYGWSVRDGGSNNGELTGIIYNFDWSVNTDLSITAKCSVVSKATIAIGVSGEQTNPSKDGTVQKDPLGKPIPDGDIAGVIERDIKQLTDQNKSIKIGQVQYYPTSSVKSGKLSYFSIGMPMFLGDIADDKLTSDQQKKKQQYNKDKEYANKQEALKQSEIARLIPLIDERQKAIEFATNNKSATPPIQYSGKEFKSLDELQDFYKNQLIWSVYGNPSDPNAKSTKSSIRELQSKNGVTENESAQNAFVTDVNTKAWAAYNASKSGNTEGSNSTVSEPTYAGKVKAPSPVVMPMYYVKLGDLTEFINKILKENPIGIDLFEVQCFGNTTQHLSKIVSASPEEVFFPDEEMGAYGQFVPFSPWSTAQSILKDQKNKKLIDLGNILISTTTVIEKYRSFVKENQTSIEYKNITGFIDELIKKVNFASGEMYQLQTQLIDPSKGGTNKKAILSIEDTNIANAVVQKVTPFDFRATIAKPILKSISISCKPPAASAAAAFTTARSGKDDNSSPVDVRYSAAGQAAEYATAVAQIDAEKAEFASKGAGPTYSTGLKGNYAKYKRTVDSGDETHWLTKILYPIDLSLTIDGIDGFKFGDVIRTNLIPSRYYDEKMVFVVTKINHTIKDGTWETTLNTKARIEPQKLPS